MSSIVEQWRNPRFGIIENGEFKPVDAHSEVLSEGTRWIGGGRDFELATAVAKDLERAAGPIAVADLPPFPTMLRKMWSGTEVQQWIDDCIKPLVQERHHAFHCDAPGAVRDTSDSVTLTGAQLLAALDFIAPDRDTDRQQLEGEVTIQYGTGHSGDGLYCWCTDEPDEGAMLLDEAADEPDIALASQAAPSAPDAQRDREISQLIDERDTFEHLCTALSDKIGELLGADVGEWSSANNPALRALHLIEDRLAAPAVALTDEQIIEAAKLYMEKEDGPFSFKLVPLVLFVRRLLTAQPAQSANRASDAALVAAEDTDPFHAWMVEKYSQDHLYRTAFTYASMREVYDFAVASQAAPVTLDAQRGSEPQMPDAAVFACYLIDRCERETITEESIRRWLADMLGDPQYATLRPPSAASLTDGQIRTVEESATKLENIGHIFSGDKQSRRLAKELNAILAAQPVSAAPLPHASDAPADDEVATIDACIAENGLEATQRAAKMILAARRSATATAAHAGAMPGERQAVIEECCAAIKEADDLSMKDDHMLDSNECISVLRELLSAAPTPDAAKGEQQP